MIEWLRPRWRHSDPQVRAAAVREMGPDEQDRLGTIARSDPDGGVRRIAIKKVDDAALLDELATSEPDVALRNLAAERLAEVRVAIAGSNGPLAECEAALSRLSDERDLSSVASSGEHDGIRRAALARVTSGRVLRDVVKSAADPAIRRAALDRIDDAAALRGIAVGDYAPELALSALERIGDVDALRAIADNRSASKKVRQRAREMLSAEAGDGPTVGHKEGRARQVTLCSAVEALSTEPNAMQAAARLRDLQREWQELAKNVPPRDDASARFTAACETILQNAASVARREAYADEARAALEESLAARRELCERVEALDGADALPDLEHARAAWSRLSPLPPEEGAALAKRFTLAGESCTARHERWLARAAQRAALDALIAEAETLADASPLPDGQSWKALEKRWTSCDRAALGSEELILAQHRFASAAERLAERRQESDQHRGERQRANLERLERLCTKLTELAAAPALKPSTARRDLQTADTALADLGPLPPGERPGAWKERLSGARDALFRRLRQEEETEEWRRWANVGLQEEIIRRVEGLLESNDLDEGMRQLARLPEEWAAVASAPPDKSRALWERFRTARNELRRRCDAYRSENLEKKRALCAQTTELGASTEWNATADLIRRLQTEWKEIGPVPDRYTRSVWQQFREPCDQFFARRREHFERQDVARHENAQQKTSLCEQVEALADSTDWDATATAIKRLQAEWKRTGGSLPRKQSEELWQRFRTACDRFFDRSRRRDELAHEAGLQRAEAICQELESLEASLGGEESPPAEQVGQRIDAAWAEWLSLGVATGDDAAGLNERLRGVCERIVAAQPATVQATRLASEATRKRREKLCSRLEALIETPEEAPRELSLREMALALRERLATNTIAGSSAKATGPRHDVAREIEKIHASWLQLGPVLDEETRAVAERFERARARATTK
jgi:hypothetical protein